MITREATPEATSTRDATSADIPQLVELAAATFPLACPPEMPADDVQNFIATELNEQVFADWISQGAVVVAINDDDHVVGYTTVLDEAHPEHPGSKYLSKCYVAPDTQGSGVAAQLMDETFARHQDSAGMWLGTNQANTRAQRFYERLGFKNIGTRRFTVGGQQAADFIYYKEFTP